MGRYPVEALGRVCKTTAQSDGTVRIRSGQLEQLILLDGNSANTLLGGPGQDGDLLLYPESAASHDFDQATIHLNAGARTIRVGSADAPGVGSRCQPPGPRVRAGKLTRP